MSELALTASFLRLGRSSFGDAKPKEVSVFGQLLVGGRGLWLFSELETGRTIRIDATGDEAGMLMAGFALAESRLGTGEDEVSRLSQRLRAEAADGEIRLTDEETKILSESVADLGVGLVLCNFPPSSQYEDAAFGTWTVQRR
jgi:hypothetical protein